MKLEKSGTLSIKKKKLPKSMQQYKEFKKVLKQSGYYNYKF